MSDQPQNNGGAAPIQHPNSDFVLNVYREVLSSLNLEEVFQRICHYVLIMLKTDRASLFSLKDNQLTSFVNAGSGKGVDVPKIVAEIIEGKGITGKALHQRRLVATANYEQDASLEHDTVTQQQVKEAGLVAMLAVPVFLPDNTVCLLNTSKRQVYEWTEDDFKVANQLVELAALAIYNAALYRQLEITNAELSDRNFELEMLYDFVQNLQHEELELNHIAKRALDLAMQAVEANAAILRLQDKTDLQSLNTILSAGFTNLAEEEGWLSSTNQDTRLHTRAFKTGQLIVVDDLQTIFDIDKVQNAASKWRSGLFVPLISANKPIGVLSLLSTEVGHYTLLHLRFAQMLAAHIVTAIEQVLRLEVEKERERLEAVLTMARTAAHQLSQPLTVLQIEIDMINQLGELPDGDSGQRLQEAINEVTTLIRQYQSITRFTTTELVPGIVILEKTDEPESST